MSLVEVFQRREVKRARGELDPLLDLAGAVLERQPACRATLCSLPACSGERFAAVAAYWSFVDKCLSFSCVLSATFMFQFFSWCDGL